MNLDDFRDRWEPLSQPIEPDADVLRVLQERIMQRIKAESFDIRFLKELRIAPLE